MERIVFHEITKGAIASALEHPRTLDMNLVDAQQARRVLDRLVGYKLSPFLWRKVAGGLSAGRVQSVAVRLIVDRENEIRAFKPQEYWSIVVALSKRGGGGAFEASLAKINGKALDKFAIGTRDHAQDIVGELKRAAYRVAAVERREVTKSPPPPFTTSTLQQEAVKRLRFSSKRTMAIAQALYERGLITYMRTDSVNLSKESTAAAKAWLESSFGAVYAAEAPRVFTAKSKLAQEAHEAIRPTDPTLTVEQAGVSDPGARALYELIWRRFLASQMPKARIAATTVTVAAERIGSGATRNKKRFELRANGQEIVFDGFLKVWQQKFEERMLPALAERDELAADEVKPEQHFTEPPPRYSEATLIKTLEENGIGRPSTYAPTISVIQVRNYVIREAGRFKPTEVGELVNRVLTEHFPEIVDVGFTAKMEAELDDIANGDLAWQNVIREFYGPFATRLAEKYEAVSKAELTTEASSERCEKCGKPMVIRLGRFGKFLACTGFPECKNTKSLGNGANREPPKRTGIRCPTCKTGELVERHVSRGRARGKMFWGCSRYPSCDYATWTNPKAKEADVKTAGREDGGAEPSAKPTRRRKAASSAVPREERPRAEGQTPA
ncbi:MAG: type I DNA topoisomerase [Planctomycetota bacterium]